MNRTARVFLAVFIPAAVLLLVWLAARQAAGTRSSGFGQAVHAALTNPVEFARTRVTGGVGLMLRMEPGTGRPVVQGVGAGCPAEAAGLRVGDVILEVNGQDTSTQSLRQVVETMRGFTGARVVVTVSRTGVTNVSFVIRRTSWNTLTNTTYGQSPGTHK